MADLPPELRAGPFTTRTGLSAGLTHRELQGPRFQRLVHGVLAPADLEITPQVLAVGVALVLPQGAVIGGIPAAALHGAEIRRPGENVVDIVTARDDQVRRPGIRSRAALLEPGDVVELFGLPVLAPVRVAFDLARLRGFVDAVVGVDAMTNRGGCSLEELAAYIDDHPGWRGVRQSRAVILEAEPLSESVMETLQRLALVRGGLPRPQAQVPVWDGSILVARLDNGYDEWRVGTDYDGEPHAHQWRIDLERQERVRDLGWWHRRYTLLHAKNGWRQMVEQVGAALLAAGWRPAYGPGSCTNARPRAGLALISARSRGKCGAC
jgi:hypothetical protein